jgi:hypothetical protein
LNPRPQQQQLSKTAVLSYIKGRQLLKEKERKKKEDVTVVVLLLLTELELFLLQQSGQMFLAVFEVICAASFAFCLV